MAYGTLREPGYEARLAEVQREQDRRAKEAQEHVAALLRGAPGAKPDPGLQPALERIAVALERIATAQERAHPVT